MSARHRGSSRGARRDDALDRGRASFARRAWADAFAELGEADQRHRLAPADLERFARSAYLAGRDDASVELWERAHRELLDSGDVLRAARCAGWLVFVLVNGHEIARSSGWIARTRRLLDDGRRDCPELGFILVPSALLRAVQGDWPGAHAIAGDAVDIGERFGELDLVTLARNVQGRALIAQQRVDEGMTMLDETMVAVTADEVSPMVAGAVYCSVIEACQQVFDSRRAQEWTTALTHWCDAQPQLVPFTGHCLLHRAEIMCLRGAWSDALGAAEQAAERLLAREGSAAGTALYQQGELHRLRGEFARAEQAYGEASRCGCEPQPGLARLRLAQGRVETAAAAIRRAVDGARGPAARSRLARGCCLR